MELKLDGSGKAKCEREFGKRKRTVDFENCGKVVSSALFALSSHEVKNKNRGSFIHPL